MSHLNSNNEITAYIVELVFSFWIEELAWSWELNRLQHASMVDELSYRTHTGICVTECIDHKGEKYEPMVISNVLFNADYNQR